MTVSSSDGSQRLFQWFAVVIDRGVLILRSVLVVIIATLGRAFIGIGRFLALIGVAAVVSVIVFPTAAGRPFSIVALVIATAVIATTVIAITMALVIATAVIATAVIATTVIAITMIAIIVIAIVRVAAEALAEVRRVRAHNLRAGRGERTNVVTEACDHLATARRYISAKMVVVGQTDFNRIGEFNSPEAWRGELLLVVRETTANAPAARQHERAHSEIIRMALIHEMINKRARKLIRGGE
jgi:hypothetical protein